MTLTVRRFDTVRDAGTVAKMFTWHDEFAWNEQDVLNSVARFPEGKPMLRLVVEEGGQTVGYGRICQVAPNPRGSFPAEVIVWPESQCRGIGRELFSRLEEIARKNAGRCVTVLVHDRMLGSLAAIAKLGYGARTMYFQSFIDPQAFDGSRFADVAKCVERSGYSIEPLSSLPDSEETDRAYYQVVHASDLDTPFMDYFGWPDFDDYRRIAMDPQWFDRDGAFIAVKDGGIVGVSTVNRGSGDFNGQMYIDYTGVLREHRGKGLAKALKVRSIEHAKAIGAKMVRTENNTDNLAMRAVNKRLGFDERPGMWLMVKELEVV